MSSKSKSKEEKEVPVELGFIEPSTDTWKLTSPFFPSKLGGKPAWLNLKHLPNSEILKCNSCGGPTRFLLQIYAPLGKEPQHHRTIYIFICSEPKCCSPKNSNKNIIAYRSQLDYVNEFYAPVPKDYDTELAKLSPLDFGTKLCRLCGILGEKHCGACSKVFYCTKAHQVLDWNSRHKKECSNPDFELEYPSSPSSITFDEFEIVVEKEVIPKSQPKKSQSDTDKLKEYENLVAEGKTGSLGADCSESTREMLEAASYKSDKVFNKFRKRVAYEPEQVIRYDLGGIPLWVSPEKIPNEADILQCPNCKGIRIFEFQIMPQLLLHLGEESIEGALDWGTIAVYTCKADCKVEGQIEFVWQQDFKPDEKDEK